ncbi:MAG: hypothetical protein JWR14_1088 [Caballeronia sp.]|jgi:hypothetical protein|nr:hypothetical protein [Caballeronia sp.]
MGRSSKLGSADSFGMRSPRSTRHDIDKPWFERLRERERESAHHITEVTIVAIGVTAGNERIAARYSEDGGAKERLDKLGKLA